ncbi:hypothetical protein G3I44_14425 [Halogeometricum borinquense]|uniref:Uncharacterized protein n=1 Tax=Halogeometricum borinquense TaxID=60847 RepID=A0A6C0UIR1_9EURY|nr:hypothetical protein [Halogeometricum borinquense]QIB75382.1 hypothetical protein G3I44_14425 [Halogeometricum borinquense]
MVDILVSGCSEEEAKNLRVAKAAEGYTSWREMMLDLAGVESDGDE